MSNAKIDKYEDLKIDSTNDNQILEVNSIKWLSKNECLEKIRNYNKEKINVNLKSASGANNWIKLSIHKSIKLSISKLKKTNTKIFAANNSEKSIDFRDANFKEPCAIILGAELDGLSKEAINFTNQEIKIPMFGMVKNLNVFFKAFGS